jgi:hypothetical protein
VRTDELRPSYHNAVRLLDEWETATSYEAGWLSGMYDGEGCFYVNDDIMQLTLSQKAGLVLDRARAAVVSVLGEQSYQSCAQTRDVWQLRLAGGRTQIAKALGILRPTRLLPKFNPEMLGEAWTASVDMVVSVEACGTEEITEIAIDTETMVVEGFAHHNCYVHGLEAAAKTTHDLYRHNSRTLREIFAAPDGVGYSADQPAGRWWARRLGAWIEEHARGGFRWHVSGDLFDPTYAWWVARVVECSPSVRHWIYTRSHAMSAAFVGVSNITVNYSVDVDNYETAKAYAAAHAAIGEPVRLCYMVTGDGHVPSDLPPGSVIFPDYSLRGSRGDTPNDQRASSSWWQSLTGEHRRMVCGVDFYGKSEKMRCGPCLKCIEPVKGTR